MPPLLMANEQGLQESIIKAKGLPPSPTREAYGNVSGDSMVERVAVWGGNLVIIGPHFRGGKEFYFADLGVSDAESGRPLELVDFDGDGHDEIVGAKEGRQQRQVPRGPDRAEGRSGRPTLLGLRPRGRHQDERRARSGTRSRCPRPASRSPRATPKASTPARSPRCSPATWARPSCRGRASVAALSLGRVKASSRRAKRASRPSRAQAHGRGLRQEAKGQAEERRATRAARAASAHVGRAPRPRVRALQEGSRRSGKPSFDFVTDVAGDRGPERVLIHGKDMVVFGKGFREGLSYAFIAVGVADPKDILDATARDLTGDGKAEIIVRAVLHAKASKALGGDTVDRHAFMVYGVQGDGLVRIFGAETGRSLGKDQIIGAVSFVPAPPRLRYRAAALARHRLERANAIRFPSIPRPPAASSRCSCPGAEACESTTTTASRSRDLNLRSCAIPGLASHHAIMTEEQLSLEAAALHSAPVGIICVSGRTGRYEFVNSEFARLIGRDRQEILAGDPFEDLAGRHPSRRSRCRARGGRAPGKRRDRKLRARQTLRAAQRRRPLGPRALSRSTAIRTNASRP